MPIPFPETIIRDYYGKLSTPQLLVKGDMFSYQIVTTDEIQKIKGVEKNEVSIQVKSETQQIKQDSSKVMPKKKSSIDCKKDECSRTCRIL